MSLVRIYARVIATLGRDGRIAVLLAVANVLVAGLQFLDPVLFGMVIQLLSQAGATDAGGPPLQPRVFSTAASNGFCNPDELGWSGSGKKLGGLPAWPLTYWLYRMCCVVATHPGPEHCLSGATRLPAAAGPAGGGLPPVAPPSPL